MGGYNRGLTFNQNLNPSLLSYTLGMGPIAVANVVMFPLDPLVGGVLGNIGLEAEIQQGFAISSTLANGGSTTTYKNIVHDYAGGGRYRFTFGARQRLLPLGHRRRGRLHVHGAQRHQRAPHPRHHLPLRSPRHRSSPGRSAAGSASRWPADTASSSTMPAPSSSSSSPGRRWPGADAELVARYALSPMFEVRAGLEWRRYWFAMHSQPGDTYAAGGAVDQSFAFTARIALLIGSSNVPKAEGGAGPRRHHRRRRRSPRGPAGTSRPTRSPAGDSESEEAAPSVE